MKKLHLGIGILVVLCLGAYLADTPSALPSVKHVKVQPSGTSTESTPSDRRELPARASRRLKIRTKSQGVGEQIYSVWSQRASAVGLLATITEQTSNEARGADGLYRQEFEAHADIAIPVDKWVWIRFRAKSNLLQSRYYRIRPSPDDESLVLNFSDEGCSVHVKLYEPGLTSPAAGQTVSLLATDLSGAKSKKYRQATDGSGYCVFRDLPPGIFLVRAPGVRPQDGIPQVARVLLPPLQPRKEAFCSLVCPSELEMVQFDLRVEADASDRGGDKLFLRARDGQLYPQHGVLKPGSNQVQYDLPAGRYELCSLPLGRLAFSPESVEVGEGTRHSVLARRRDANCHVTLSGIPSTALPIRVSWEDPNVLQLTDLEHLFMGPSRWGQADAVVALPRPPARLIAMGRQGVFLARSEVGEGPRQEFEMEPATYMTIEWLGSRSSEGCTVIFQSTGIEIGRMLRPKLVPRKGGRMIPALVCSAVVPRGEFTLRSFDLGGNVEWERTVTAAVARQFVEVAPD